MCVSAKAKTCFSVFLLASQIDLGPLLGVNFCVISCQNCDGLWLRSAARLPLEPGVETGCGLYLDPKWLSWIDHGALPSILLLLLVLLCRCYRSRRRARSMFSSPSIPSNALRCEGRTHPRLKNAPPSRARPREGERRCLWSPGLMGGLAGGRVRSICKRGIPKKKSRSRHSVKPGS